MAPKRRRRPPAKQGALVNRSSAPAHKPFQNGSQAAALVADPAFRCRARRLHTLGSRVGAELLAELAVKHGCQDEIERFIDRVCQLEPVIRELGVAVWPEPPLRLVQP